MIAARMVRSLTDTQPETLVTSLPHPTAADRAGVREPSRRNRFWAAPLAAVGILALVAIVVAALLPARLVASKDVERDGETVSERTPYAVVPASVQAVADRVSYEDLGDGIAVDTDPDGRVFFVTVSEPAQSVLGWWLGRDEPEIRFLTTEEKFGTQTPSQRRTIALQMMRTSSQVAQFVALSLAGYEPELVPGPVQIEQMLCLDIDGQRCAEYVPSAEQLDEGDTIVAVDGSEIGNIDDLTSALADNQPGDVVQITVDRVDVGEVDVDVELMDSPDNPGRAIIGFVPVDTDSVRLPFEIAFDTGEIGGPSAGLAFTLTLLDELTAGDLLGGDDVAVTGTIGLEGDVGAIGGLPQKASAVRQAGIGHFIVPAGQSDEELAAARAIAGDDVELIPVATIDEALVALERIGGDPLPAT
jgi:Lon-like protease